MMSTLSPTVSNLHNGIRLVDSEALACITSFCFPSAAASVQCLAWAPSAPGMFITGGKACVSVWDVCMILVPFCLDVFMCMLDLPFNLRHNSQLVCGTCCCHSVICLCIDAFLLASQRINVKDLVASGCCF